MSIYAQNTVVSVERSRAEIEAILSRYGATAFAYATNMDKAMIKFQASNRHIMFVLQLPDREAKIFTHGYAGKGRKLGGDEAYRKWEQACRQKWRCLSLAIKAKLESVESGIASFEDEFMAHILMPDGKTVSQHTAPMIQQAYDSGKMLPLLPDFSGNK